MKMKKLKQKNFVRLLGVCSFLIAMIAMVGTILMPTSSKADAVHYLRPYQSTNATIYDGVAGKSFQMAGTQYSRGITSGQRYSTMDAEFYLGGQVSSVSFTLGHWTTKTTQLELLSYIWTKRYRKTIQKR